jgi:GH15 family glucan-1,4-alpha-glucosidase
VARSGSIDWLCWPRFDSPACFAALLGTSEHGRWLIAPQAPDATVRRAYRDGSPVLETIFTTPAGEVAVIDFMPIGAPESSVVRIVEGRRGQVGMRMELAFRFDYGAVVPWVTRLQDGSGVQAIAGPDKVVLRSPAPLHGRHLTTVSAFTVSEGQSIPFVLTHADGHEPTPPALDAQAALAETEAWWTRWSAQSTYRGPYQDAVQRSLITLKALTFAPTGGMVAAPTTSLPEQPGGSRNWDYRYCWLRDTALVLQAFMRAGYFEEARAWRDWLHRAIAGSPAAVRTMYGLAGERRLAEWEVDWLPGYHGARPVRVGNAAVDQLQIDVYGEVMDALEYARQHGLVGSHSGWRLQRNLVEHLEGIWQQPDEGIWEVRGGRRHFTFSRIMAWVAFDRAIAAAENFGLAAPLERWREVRARIHATVCEQGFNARRGSFVQSFGTDDLDASLLMIPTLGFLPADDPRVLGTVAAIERELVVDGLVLRYDTRTGRDGLPPYLSSFLPCNFWLVDNYTLQGRHPEAVALFERLLALRNDVGLLAEEYDPVRRCQAGNFPQAFSHTALVGAAIRLGG